MVFGGDDEMDVWGRNFGSMRTGKNMRLVARRPEVIIAHMEMCKEWAVLPC